MALIVLVTAPKKNARSLAKKVLESKACACVNIIKEIDSFFWWEEKIDKAKESLLIIKTKNTTFPRLKKIIKANHPYKAPEIIGVQIDKINREYLSWLNKETNG